MVSDLISRHHKSNLVFFGCDGGGDDDVEVVCRACCVFLAPSFANGALSGLHHCNCNRFDHQLVWLKLAYCAPFQLEHVSLQLQIRLVDTTTNRKVCQKI